MQIDGWQEGCYIDVKDEYPNFPDTGVLSGGVLSGEVLSYPNGE